MGRFAKTAKDTVVRLRILLRNAGTRRFVKTRRHSMMGHLRSADALLRCERQRLAAELQREDDPLRRYDLQCGIAEIEMVLERRRLLEKHPYR